MTGWGRREKAQGLGNRREGEKNRREGKGRERGWSPQLRNCIVAHICDLEHSRWCIICDVIKLCSKFESNRAIRGEVIAISEFDLMTLTMWDGLRSALR